MCDSFCFGRLLFSFPWFPVRLRNIRAILYLQPRSQGICSWEAKTLVDAGHVTHRKLIASEGDGKVSYYMFPLPHFTLRCKEWSFCTIIFENHIYFKILAKLVSVCRFKLYKHGKMQILIVTDKSGNQATKTYDRMV